MTISVWTALGALALVPLAGTAAAAPASPPVATATASEDARLTAFLDAEFAEELKLRPQLATRLGSKEGQDRFDDISDAGMLRRLEWRRGSIARLKAGFDRARLTPEAQANFDIWALSLDREELSYKYRRYTPPFYSFLSSVHAELPNFLIATHGVKDTADMRAYIARLRAIPAVLDTAIAQSRLADAAGIRAPKFAIERVIAGSKALIAGAPFGDGPDAPLWADAKAKIGKLALSSAEKDALLADARAAVLAIGPGYERVIAWAEGELPTAPSGKVGAASLPGGRDWYAAALKLNTTTDLTAKEIHAIGLKEVARIQAEQDALARQAGFADRDTFYADRAKRFPPVPWTDALRADYLARANAAIARNRDLLPRWFGNLPQYRMEVIREPAFSEVAGGAAHASAPSPDGARPGRVYLHMLGTTIDPAQTIDLMCHEGVPGHVLQGDIQARASGGPKFRKAYGYVAFSEGWGLYAERVCKEMGAYPDVASDFMRLDAELFRATRLVVDTGIHDLGWSEQEAGDYLIRVGRVPPPMGRSEVRRYITVPGQATGYKIGMLKIMELRGKAEAALGAKFDIRGFNDLLIGSGSLPLSVLERRVADWVAGRK